jgi:putative transcriptional regulator
MGLVINQPSAQITFPELLEKLEIIDTKERIQLPPYLAKMPVQTGGPVDIGRGFVLHTTDDYTSKTTLEVASGIGLTATLDILRAIAKGTGPRKSITTLGYSGWGPGQLEREIQENGWLMCDADQSLIFDETTESRYPAALRRIGIDPAMLSGAAGHA